MAMHDDINITSIPVTGDSECRNRTLEFFSTEGVVKLEISNIFFVKLSYSVVTSVSGTHTDLL